MKKISITISMIMAVCFCKPNLLSAQVNVQDSLALVDLYNSTNGPHWGHHGNWLTTAPVSSWYHITVTNNRVTAIALDYNNLSGSIPASIVNLSELKTLALNSNRFIAGDLPAGLSKLTHLMYLNLNTNRLTGNIPKELGVINSLLGINLSHNKFTGIIPEELGNLSNLNYLQLAHNEFTGNVPASLSNLSALQYLDLSENKLEGNFFNTLIHLTNLTHLDLNHNKLTDNITSNISNLSHLSSLILSNNNISGSIPHSIGNLTNLDYLDLSFNQLTGDIPSELGNLANLSSYLLLNNNRLSGKIPFSIGNLVKVQVLNLSFNKLDNKIPSSFANLTSLLQLYLQSNKLTFAGLENTFRRFPFCQYSPQANIPLHQNGNSLSVSAGGELAHNTYNWYKDDNLVATITGDSTYRISTSGKYSVAVTNSIAALLTLYSDSLIYQAPAINKTDSLALVDFYYSTNGPNWTMQDNWLTAAPVSTWFGITVTGDRVTAMLLGGTGLGGPIPASIGNLTALEHFSATYGITGTLPSSIGNLKNLESLALFFCNDLTGPLPSSIGNLENLQTLYLYSNNIHGTIPSSLGNLKKLLLLYLAGNKLTGNIPNSLNNLTNLKVLDLSFNKLSGKIPNFANLQGDTILSLRANKFTFAGMENLARNFPFADYQAQAYIPLNKNGNSLSVSAGGELFHNTYKWYKGSTLVATITGDSTYQPSQSGNYSVAVSNSVATGLTLYSDTVIYTVSDNLIAGRINNKNALLSVYPNPAKSNATLAFNATGKYSVTVTDISGKKLQTKTGVSNKEQNIVQLDVSKYASGLYLIIINDEKNNKQVLKLNKE